MININEMSLIERKLLIETALQICAFNYKTGDVIEDVKKYWYALFSEKDIPNNIEHHFQKHLRYYYFLYSERNSKLPKDNKVLLIYLKELLIKKVIGNLNDGVTYTVFCNKIKNIFVESKINIPYQRDLDSLKDDFKNLKKYASQLKKIENYIDLIINVLAEKVGIENIYPLQKIEFDIHQPNDTNVLNPKHEKTKSDETTVVVNKIDEISYLALKEENTKLKEQIEYLKNRNIDLADKFTSEKEKNIKDIIELLDSEELEYPLGNLYVLCNNAKSSEKKIKGYLNNFFIALEQNGIIPYNVKEINECIDIKEKDICCKYRINCDISKTKSKKGKYVLPGWQYDCKDIVLPLVEVERVEVTNEE